MGDYFGCDESPQYFSARGSKSRNKVAVGEPAAGSLPKSDTGSWIPKVEDGNVAITNVEENPKLRQRFPSAAARN